MASVASTLKKRNLKRRNSHEQRSLLGQTQSSAITAHYIWFLHQLRKGDITYILTEKEIISWELSTLMVFTLTLSSKNTGSPSTHVILVCSRCKCCHSILLGEEEIHYGCLSSYKAQFFFFSELHDDLGQASVAGGFLNSVCTCWILCIMPSTIRLCRFPNYLFQP